MSLRPSKLSQLSACPGSLALEATLPEQIEATNEYAERGKHLHTLVGNGILKPMDRLTFLDETETVEDAETLEACWRHAEGVWAGLTPEQQAKATLAIEKEVDLACLSMEKGTPDFVITVADEGVVVLDWKFGRSYVPPAKYNLQLQAYAYASLRNAGIQGWAKIVIVQPTAKDIDVYIMSAEEVAEIEGRIKNIVARCNEANPAIIPGPQCQWCKAKAKCEPRLMVCAEVKQIADPVAVIKAMLPHQRKELYEKLSSAISMLEAAKKSIDGSLLAGELDIDGYGIGAGKKGRFWKADNGQTISSLQIVAVGKGINPLDVVEPISVSAAEKLLGKKEVADMFACKEGNPTVKRIGKEK